MKAQNLSELVGVVEYIAPDAYAASTVLSGAIDMSKWSRILVIVQAGDLGASATLDVKLTASATSGGSYADISGAAITQLTQAGTDSNKTVVLELKAESMPAGKRYVKVSLTVATATSDCGAVVIGVSKYKPVTGFDLATGEGAVDEVVVV